ncbi:MAG: PLP-dependent aminotransferase family protein [Myxococcota bacterium]
MTDDAGQTSAPPLTRQDGAYVQSKTDPETVNLGLGQPSPRLLPVHLMHQAAARTLGPGADPLMIQYGSIAGHAGIREALAELLSRRYRFPIEADGLVMTGGISSALSFVAQVFARPGQAVVCSDPTYFLARGIFESQGLPTVGIPVDEGGLRVDLLQARLEAGLRPAFVYCMPSFHNPYGVDLEPARARHLVELAERYDFLVVADEPYVMLHFDPAPPPCMMAYDEGRARVLSLGSFSKILGPGLRLGWLHAEASLLERFCEHGALRSGGGLNPMVCALVENVIHTGELDRHIDELKDTFTTRARTLSAALRRHLPSLPVPEPRGGYFIWLPLPSHYDTTALLDTALEQQVGFTPGARCAVDLDLSHCLRVCFAFYEPHELELGVERLAAVLDLDG